jgi:hypothetical protein
MPYTLHLLYADDPLPSVAAAEALLERDAGLKPKGHLLGRYRSFQAGMVENCPDLSEDDPHADRRDNAWPLGLPERFETAVYSFTPNTGMFGEGLLGLIAESVAQHGLHMLDPQAGQLFRPDRVVLDRQGTRSTPPPMQVPASARAAIITWDRTEELAQPLQQALAARLHPHGFAPRDGGERGLIRRNGSIGQNLQVTAYHSHGGVTLYGQYLLFAPAVTAQWVAPLAAEFERYFGFFGKALGGRVDGHSLCTDELCGTDGEPWGRYRFGHARTREPLQRWFQAFGDHVVAAGVPALDAVATPRDLARLLLTERMRWRLATKNDVRLVEIFGMLVLAHAFCPDQADAWLTEFRRPGRNSAGFEGWQQPDALIDRLVAHLQSPAFDPASVGGDLR